MRYIKKILPIFFVSLIPSFLCCATKDLEEEYSRNYDDINVVPTLKAFSVEGDKSIYDLTITNEGNGYIIKDFPLSYYIDSHNQYSFQFPKDNEIFSCIELIKPGDTYTLEVEVDTNENLFEQGHFYTYAYIEPRSGLFNYIPKTAIKNGDYYEIDEEIIGRQSTFIYQYAVTLEYLGNEYCIKCEDNSNNKVYFKTSTEIDLTQLKIKNINAFCYRHVEVVPRDGMNSLFMAGLLSVIVIPSIIVFVILLVTVLITIAVVNVIKYKKKRKE